MKIRTGFVANSSSSSFIIQCEKVPTSHQEARDIWFGEKQKYIPEIVSEHIFEKMKPIEFSIEKVKELIEQYSYNELCDMESNSNEMSFIDSICHEFWFEHKYNDAWFNGVYFASNYNTWLQDKLNLSDDDFHKIQLRDKDEHENEYFDLPEIKEAFKREVESKLFDLDYTYPKKETKVFMMGEIADESEIGCEVEHNDSYWEKMPGYVRFSNH